MFSYFSKKKEQKKLFYQLDYFFKQQSEDKISGIYIIFKDDICLYVGQSKNIPSRIATHLCGKYKESTKIIILESTEDNDYDLMSTEKYVIQRLKPIENIIVDFTEKIDTNNIMSCNLINWPNIDNDYSYIIFNDKYDLFIANNEVNIDLVANLHLLDFLSGLTSKVSEYINSGKK